MNNIQLTLQDRFKLLEVKKPRLHTQVQVEAFDIIEKLHIKEQNKI